LNPFTRRGGPLLLALLLAFAIAAGALAQGPGGKKKDGGAAVALLVAPLLVLVSATLQVAVMGVFPRFGRRCAAAVRRYRWQTPLAGLAGFLGTLLLAAVANWAAGGNQQAGIPVVSLASLIATIGGVGPALVAGRWAAQRAQPDQTAHPLLEVLAGTSALGWGMILVPCVGQLLWLVTACASLGAFILAVLLGHRLDEVRAKPAPPVAVSPPPPPEAPGPRPAEPNPMF